MKNNIVLIGMMGAGKSITGENLAKIRENFALIDIDKKIEEISGMKISEIFEQLGEEHFRRLETQIIRDVCSSENQIIAIGGGAFEREENREILKENGIIFYLKATSEILYSRIKSETHRPLLKDIEDFAKLLQKREKNYELAHFTIDTGAKTPYNIALEVLKNYEQ